MTRAWRMERSIDCYISFGGEGHPPFFAALPEHPQQTLVSVDVARRHAVMLGNRTSVAALSGLRPRHRRV